MKIALRLFALFILLLAMAVSALKDIRLLSDNTPDWTTIESAAFSITNSLTSDEQKAIAITKWVSAMRHQVPSARDSFSMSAAVPYSYPKIIYNSVKLANNYGNTFCVSTNSIPALLWQSLGKEAREYDIVGHTVCDLYWDGEWHNFDAAFGFYYKDTTSGKILSCQEVINNRYDMRKMMSDVTSASRLDPTKTGNISIYQGKGVYDILINTREYERIQATRTTLLADAYSDSYTYRLHIKPFERYTRRWKQIAPNIKYYISETPSGITNPNTTPILGLNIMSNGVWSFKPDLVSPAFLKAVSTVNLAQSQSSPNIRPTNTIDTALFIYRVDAANIISHAELTAKIVRSNPSTVFEIYFSADSLRWYRIFKDTTTGENEVALAYGRNSDLPAITGLPTYLARTRVSYYLKFVIATNGLSTDNCGLNELSVTTYTIVNPRTLPKLTLGSNRIKLTTEQAEMEPIDVSYHWTEIERTGQTTVQPVFRSHKNTVTTNGEEWLINTGGVRNPTTDSISISYHGLSATPLGYNDGIDVGAAYEAPKYYYTFGKNIAINCSSYAAVDTVDTRPLTDNSAGNSSASVLWDTGSNPSVVINLGRITEVGGVRVMQVLTSGTDDYLDSCSIFAKKYDADNWQYRGTFYQRQVWEPITNYFLPNTFDMSAYYRLKNMNLTSYKFSYAFDTPDSAQLIKLSFYNNRNSLELQEIEIYDKMTKERVNNEIDHGFLLPDPSFTAKDNGTALEQYFNTDNSILDFADAISAVPNPFNPIVRIRILGIKKRAKISIFSVTGRAVLNSVLTDSDGFFEWIPEKGTSAGLYIIRSEVNGKPLRKKISLVK